MNALRLQFPDRQPVDLELGEGVHAIGRDPSGRIGPVGRDAALVFISVDERGIWLQAREGARGLHVNGRRVRRMAMLRPGDSIFLDGAEMLLVGREPLPAPADDTPADGADSRLVLRGIGGRYHGRCIALDAPRSIGAARTNDVRVEDGAMAPRRAVLHPDAAGIVLRGEGGEGLVVNGHEVRSALLAAGDQLVVDARHRFLLEAPAMTRRSREVVEPDPEPEAAAAVKPRALPPSVRRAPWLLLAALLISVALSLLLLYGAH